VSADPGDRVLWLPAGAVPIEHESAFLPGEIAEYRGDTTAALEVYRRLLDASDEAVRAGALVRLARVHRSARRWDDALEHYRQLETMAHVRIAGTPADLQARRAICDVLAQAARREALDRESAALRDDLNRGRWTLDRPAWELTAADIERWTGAPVPVERDRLAVSNLAARLWPAASISSSTTRRSLWWHVRMARTSRRLSCRRSSSRRFWPKRHRRRHSPPDRWRCGTTGEARSVARSRTTPTTC
jgi:tetratricopeptide (TPR) repeat protein